MIVKGVDRPWWWYPGKHPVVSIAVLTVCALWFTSRAVFDPASKHVIPAAIFFLAAASTAVSAWKTRRMIDWERDEF